MPWGLKRYQETGQLHFLTFSCYHRQPKLMAAEACAVFEGALERTRQQHGLQVYGYVLMPEHVHMLVSEPESGVLARAMLSLKQSVSRTLALRAAEPFWQARYYDFNVWSEHKFVEKLRYIHRNPVKAGLARRAPGLRLVERSVLPARPRSRVVGRGSRASALRGDPEDRGCKVPEAHGGRGGRVLRGSAELCAGDQGRWGIRATHHERSGKEQVPRPSPDGSAGRIGCGRRSLHEATRTDEGVSGPSRGHA